MLRIAFRYAYFGWNYHGNQFQPNLRTVDGEIFKALSKLGIDAKKGKYRISARTDAGVSAIGNVFALNLESFDEWFLIVLNEKLPDDIIVWGYKIVDENFNPRKAISRTYAYIMPDLGYDVYAMKVAASMLIGKHNFEGFTKGCKPCVREIYRSEIFKKKDFIIYEIEGNAFAWNMVRKIVTALKIVGRSGRAEVVREILGGKRIPLSPASPLGLVLKDVKFDFEFNIERKSYNLLKKRFREKFIEFSHLYGLFDYSLSFLGNP